MKSKVHIKSNLIIKLLIHAYKKFPKKQDIKINDCDLPVFLSLTFF